jgi:hypothetical protein
MIVRRVVAMTVRLVGAMTVLLVGVMTAIAGLLPDRPMRSVAQTKFSFARVAASMRLVRCLPLNVMSSGGRTKDRRVLAVSQ